MKFKETSDLYSLNKSTYANLRWIAYSGQFITVVLVQFLFKFHNIKSELKKKKINK